MQIAIRKAPDRVYDVWEGDFDKWLFSTVSPDNLLSGLAEIRTPFTIKFFDAELEELKEKFAKT